MANILVVDDDDVYRRMLSVALTQMGHTMVDAANGREALAQVRRAAPEVVITDIMMPEKDGLELVTELHRHFPAVKILTISGGGRMNAADVLRMSKLFGAHRTLAKPFTLQQLGAEVEALLRA